MRVATRQWMPLVLPLLLAACGGDQERANDTALPGELPAADEPPRGAVSTWNPAAGPFFAIRSGAATAWLVNPSFNDAQVLDTLTSWAPEGTALSLLDGGRVVGTATIGAVRYDSTCAGWPTAPLMPADASTASWRVAFPGSLIDGVAWDSLPDLSAPDSAARTRLGALTASRLPDDTSSAFRGRPFVVRQASQLLVAGDTTAVLFEVVRLVAQEANPLEEKLLIVVEGAPPDAMPRTVLFRRDVGHEETLASMELLAAVRIRQSGALALLVRREREGGFVLEWIERSPRGRWTVRWRSALDGC